MGLVKDIKAGPGGDSLEQVVVRYAHEFPQFGQARAAGLLKEMGYPVSASGVTGPVSRPADIVKAWKTEPGS